jgi:hypothetical protein
MLREKLSLDKHESLCIIVADGQLPSGHKLMKHIYAKHKDTDDLLYITYVNERFAG